MSSLGTNKSLNPLLENYSNGKLLLETFTKKPLGNWQKGKLIIEKHVLDIQRVEHVNLIINGVENHTSTNTSHIIYTQNFLKRLGQYSIKAGTLKRILDIAHKDVSSKSSKKIGTWGLGVKLPGTKNYILYTYVSETTAILIDIVTPGSLNSKDIDKRGKCITSTRYYYSNLISHINRIHVR